MQRHESGAMKRPLPSMTYDNKEIERKYAERGKWIWGKMWIIQET